LNLVQKYHRPRPNDTKPSTKRINRPKKIKIVKKNKMKRNRESKVKKIEFKKNYKEKNLIGKEFRWAPM